MPSPRAAAVLLLASAFASPLPARVFDPPSGAQRPGGFYTALADFDGDGFVDLAGALPDQARVSVLRGDGAGGFGREWTAAVGAYPFAVVADDFDENGDLDLAVTSDRYLFLLRGNGDGTFGTEAHFPLGSDICRFATAGDFNEDGHRDVAVAIRNPYRVAVLLGNGDGTFQPFFHLPTAIGRPRAIVAQDFDEDGHQDLAVASEAYGELAVHLGRGDGGFHPETVMRDVPPGSTDMVTGDFNRDGHADLALSSTGGASAQVRLGGGDGTFGITESIVLTDSVFGLDSADFNRDGRLDLAAATVIGFGRADAVYALGGSGTGNFTREQELSLYAFVTYVEHALAGDINGDGYPDLVLSPGAIVLLNSATPTGSCADTDADGYGAPGDSSCPGGGATDCADTEPARSPGRLEICDGADNDCDLAIDEGFDRDGDGVRTCAGDCDDGDAEAFPGAAEVCDGSDDDCDGRADEEPEATASCSDDGFPCSVETCEPALGCGADASACRGMDDVASLFPGQVLRDFDRPIATAAADFDEDGHQDLVVADLLVQEVAILRGDGGGGFSRRGTLRLPAYPYQVTPADLNADGHQDLLVRAEQVWVALGNGDGTFHPLAPYAAGYGSGEMIAADFDGDGVLDVATVNISHWDVSVLPGHGDGTLGPQARYPVGSLPYDLAVGDLDRDGRLDLVTANYGANSISILRGLGPGGFAPENRAAVGEGPIALVVEDFDQDGNLDVAAANYTYAAISVLPGNGDGTFGFESFFPTESPFRDLVASDLDGNGTVDLAAAATRLAAVFPFLGDGKGHFVPATSAATSNYPRSISAADFDDDGITDLVTTNDYTDDLTVLLGAGDGSFPSPWRSFAAGGNLQNLVEGDFNTDGLLDVAAADWLAQSVWILLGVGGGELGPPVQFRVVGNPWAVMTADLDGDGVLDLLVNDGLIVEALRGLGDGSFSLWTRTYVEREVTRIGLGDVNLDGWLDAVTTHYEDQAISVLLARGDGRFEVSGFVPTPGRAKEIAVADVNGDLRPDLVVTNAGDAVANVSVHPGNGDGTFGQPLLLEAAAGAEGVAVADLDLDDAPDLVVASDGGVTVFVGTGDGRFAGSTYPAAPIRLWSSGYAVRIEDFNADGVPDVAAEADGDVVAVLPGNGDGSLAGAVIFDPGKPYSFHLATGDLDADGRPDLAVVSQQTAVSVALNRGPLSGCLDRDLDGYGWPGNPACPGGAAKDCDDGRAAVFPGATEACDLLDNDCDLAIDEAADGDGDGWHACRDCNDTDVTVFPGAEEINDGLDNQCPGSGGFGLVDELSGPVSIGIAGALLWAEQPGARRYQLARSASGDFSIGCATFTSKGSPWDEGEAPAAGRVFFYLVRPFKPTAGSWGTTSAGVERTLPCMR